MPSTSSDARDLLIASTLCDDPVVFIDDRWLYDEVERVDPVGACDLATVSPRVVRQGQDITLVGAGHSALLCRQAADLLKQYSVDAEVVDLRIVAPLNVSSVVTSVQKTGRLCVVDGSWETCGLAGEIIAAVIERLDPAGLRAAPKRVTLPAASAPTSRTLEAIYYPTAETVLETVLSIVGASAGCTG
jgi:pyruvate dehydrogenase E1 component beta subunit